MPKRKCSEVDPITHKCLSKKLQFLSIPAGLGMVVLALLAIGLGVPPVPVADADFISDARDELHATREQVSPPLFPSGQANQPDPAREAITLALPFPEAEPGPDDLPSEDLPEDATIEWWATVQEQIRREMYRLSPGSTDEAVPTYHSASAALYPLTIGPLIASPSWTATGENDWDYFGISVATAGDVNGDGYADVIAGAYGYSSSTGRVYVYYGGSTGLSTTPAFSATGENGGDQLGISVASAGDVNGDGYADVIIGASGFNSGRGRAYVYHGSNTGLSATPAFSTTGESMNDNLGDSVASAGDINGDGYADVIVGTPYYDDNGNNDAGRVYVYHGDSTGLSATPAFSVTGENTSDLFGSSVAAAGDVNGDGFADVIVGAHYNNDGSTDAGKAYVYHGSSAGLSTTPTWTKTGELESDEFGFSVATAGDVNGDGYADVIVGAYVYGASDAGKAYVYHGSSTGLSTAPALSTVGENANDSFGWSVASAGDANGDGYADVIVGAKNHNSNQGKVYIYRGSATGLSAAAALTATGESGGDEFGISVTNAGDVNGDGYADVIVGADSHDSGKGKVYVYHGGGGELSVTPAFTVTGENNGDHFGLPVATAGDVNGDGHTDVIVGAYGYNTNQGKAYVYHGGGGGLSVTPAFTATGENSGDHFGVSVATAGDVNGDGYADVIIGASGYPGGLDQGKVYVYYGGSGGLSATPAFSATGENNGDGFGFPVATAGDVNGGGYADIIVGAPTYPNNSYQGKAYLYYGGSEGLGNTPAFTATGENASDTFGISVATAGDVNGDGYADIIVGAIRFSTETGKVYVYHGSSGGLSSTPVFTATGENNMDYLGISVATMGDVNGDGYADVIVGAYRYPNGSDMGRAYVYHGGDGGLSAPPAFIATGENDNDEFGKSVATAGDVNGDGYADAIVGARAYNTLQGRVYVYYGSATGLSATPAFTDTGESILNSFGYSAATAGDVNGDGYADIIVGARDYPNGSGPGRAYVYHGNEGGGRVVLARQGRGDGSGFPVQPWGLSYDTDGFQVHLNATDPMGRGRVKLQVQACPPGAPFGHASCQDHISADWMDVTTAATGVTLTTTITGLADDTLYHWRARVLYAPLHVTQPGVTPPPNPAHGPWRRFLGQGLEADLQTGVLPLPTGPSYLPIIMRSYTFEP